MATLSSFHNILLVALSIKYHWMNFAVLCENTHIGGKYNAKSPNIHDGSLISREISGGGAFSCNWFHCKDKTTHGYGLDYSKLIKH
jgi:hypothetical protein